MKRKKIIPLVSLIVLIALGIIGAAIYCFNTGDTKKSNNAVEQETAKENLSKTTDTNTNDDSIKDDSDNEKSTEKEKTINKETNSSQSKANTNETKNEEKSSSNTSTNKQDTQSSSNTNSTSKEEPKNNSTTIEIPNEDNKDNVSSFENDEEYIKLKSTLEFETRAECQTAADIIGPEYALQGNLRNTSCKSFAYKGTVIGYRLQIWFTDGTWIYNN